MDGAPRPSRRLGEAEKQTRIVLEELPADHPQAARLSFVADELSAIVEEL